ncbi:cupin domain-containing protein [Pseudoruegeria sp. HB172150]|uniref:cupin domain-containing protein n=1 Tax=Pseudoruegeria sp. HB172150 TaxID=2721164 RepID=UPI00155715B1|nr:cupin domain-containing protein [Pseudoruegeria sp. HB172150]
MTVLHLADIPAEPKRLPWPAPFNTGIGPGTHRNLGDPGGLTQFGVHLETLAPGARSTHRHWHAQQDEMIYLLDGELTVTEDDGDHIIRPGDAACWPAGAPNGHAMRNHTGAPATYLVIGARRDGESVTYSDIDLKLVRPEGGTARFTRADGSPLDSTHKGD